MSRLVLERARISAVAIAIAAIACGLTWVAEPAQAHAQLVESAPADGEVLETPPEEVALRFSDELLELGGMILVTDTAGRSWTEGDLVYDRSEARIALQSGMPDEWYEIRWQVVSADGHPISGVISFAVGEAGARPLATAPAAEADGLDGAQSSGSGLPGAMRIVLVGLIGAAVAAGAYLLARWLLRRRDSRHGTGRSGSP